MGKIRPIQTLLLDTPLKTALKVTALWLKEIINASVLSSPQENIVYQHPPSSFTSSRPNRAITIFIIPATSRKRHYRLFQLAFLLVCAVVVGFNQFDLVRGSLTSVFSKCIRVRAYVPHMGTVSRNAGIAEFKLQKQPFTTSRF